MRPSLRNTAVRNTAVRNTAVRNTLLAGAVALVLSACTLLPVRGSELDAPRGETGYDFPTAPPPGPCPASGYVIWAGGVDGAMGQRHVPVSVTNCGRRPVRLPGYPQVELLDGRGRPLPVTVVRATAGAPAGGLSLPPGGTAVSWLAWRLLVEAGGVSLTSSQVSVAIAPGEPAQHLALPVDLGTTRDVRATAWQS